MMMIFAGAIKTVNNHMKYGNSQNEEVEGNTSLSQVISLLFIIWMFYIASENYLMKKERIEENQGHK